MSDTHADGTARSPGKHAPRSVLKPALSATASSSSVMRLLPMPASPRMTSVEPRPSPACFTAAPRRLITASRPTNTAGVAERSNARTDNVLIAAEAYTPLGATAHTLTPVGLSSPPWLAQKNGWEL